jgi:hypothetical protein
LIASSPVNCSYLDARTLCATRQGRNPILAIARILEPYEIKQRVRLKNIPPQSASTHQSVNCPKKWMAQHEIRITHLSRLPLVACQQRTRSVNGNTLRLTYIIPLHSAVNMEASSVTGASNNMRSYNRQPGLLDGDAIVLQPCRKTLEGEDQRVGRVGLLMMLGRLCC